MNKQQLKSLTWKYFWQQKFVEVGSVIMIILALIFLPYIVGHAVGNNHLCYSYYSNETDSKQLSILETQTNEFHDVSRKECVDFGGSFEEISKVGIWFEGIGWLMFAGGIMLVIFCLAVLIIVWGKNNWNRATDRAKKELRK